MQIHLSRNGQAFGVHDADAVKAGLRGGVFLPTDLAWHEGAPGWLPLSQMPGFVETAPPPVAPSAPPAPPPAPATYQPQAQPQFTSQAPPPYPSSQRQASGQYGSPAGPAIQGRRGVRWWVWLIVVLPLLAGVGLFIKHRTDLEAEERGRAEASADIREYDRTHPDAPFRTIDQDHPNGQSLSAPSVSNDPTVLQAPTLVQAYQRDAAAAAAQYQGKKLTITGKVVYAGTNPMNMTSVLLEGDTEGNNISCSFPAVAKGMVDSLRKGQTATIRGIGDRYQYGSVALENCELVR